MKLKCRKHPTKNQHNQEEDHDTNQDNQVETTSSNNDNELEQVVKT